MKLRRGEKIELVIDRLSVGGRGVARHEGVVIFVPNAAPGDRLMVELSQVKKSFAEAEIVRILEPSLHRVTPPCPVAGVCGGCTWQHVEYPEQLRQKQGLVRESLRKFSGFDVSAEDSVQPTVPSPKPFRYRNRVQLHFDRGRLGFFRKGSRELVDITDCPITDEAIASKIPELKTSIGKNGAGRFEMLLTRDGGVTRRNATSIDGDHVDHGGLAFSQVNTEQNEALVQAVVATVVDLLGPDQTGTIYDLYCGNGNFTFPLAKALPNSKLVGVELNIESIRIAREQSVSLGLAERINWHIQDVGTFLTNESVPTGSILLLDPPRVGCTPDVITALAASNVSRIVYVSCHPVTLGRDLNGLREAGFKLRSVVPFDMFPQTDHVETLAVLERV
ncbi:MAG: class I SAM-dependent RNA methyltransferase [Bdellovibrionota bacterium]